MLRPLLALGCMTAATAVGAEPVALSSEAIKETLSGSLVELDTPAGSTIPVRFQEDGLMSGEAGPLASVLGAERDRGRWWAADDRLCVKWFRWFDAEVRCASLRQDGTRIFWREQGGETGTATIAERAKPVVKPAPPPFALGAEQVAKEQTDKEQVGTSAETQVAKSVEAPAPETQAGEQQATNGESSSADPPPLRFAGMALGAAPSIPPEAHAPGSSFDPRRLSPVHKEPVKVATATTQSTAQDTRLPAQVAAPVAAHPVVPPPAARAPAAGPSPPPSLMSFRVAGVAEDDTLNVRSGPSEYHPRVGAIPPASRGVRIVGPCRDDWCPIQHGRVSGWVNRYYLAVESYGASPGFRSFESGAYRQGGR